jgi:hypothetical protein
MVSLSAMSCAMLGQKQNTGCQNQKKKKKKLREEANLLIGIHAGKASRVAGLAALTGDLLDLLPGSVGEVARVCVGRHVDFSDVGR